MSAVLALQASVTAQQAAVTRRRHSLGEYQSMAEAQVFPPGERIELIEGEIVNMAPIGRSHEWHVIRLNHVLTLALAGRALVSPQNSIALPPDSAPQPDIVLIDAMAWDDNPRIVASQVRLVVEIADTSLAFDQEVKARLYARHGIAEMWIIDVNQHVLWAYRHPVEGLYPAPEQFGRGDRIAPLAYPDVEIDLAQVLR